MTEEHIPESKAEGVFYKYESRVYRKTCLNCGKGYHGNRWDAHHILPGKCFKTSDSFVLSCLRATPYNINNDVSMAGLPKLTAYILALQNDPNIPYEKHRELTVTMRRWASVKQYAYQKKANLPITLPNHPVHTPVNWGHTDYNKAVENKIQDSIVLPLQKARKRMKHPKPLSILRHINVIKDFFWGRLASRTSSIGGGGHVGVYANMKNRYDTAKNGWWKPMCMWDLSTAGPPTSPKLR